MYAMEYCPKCGSLMLPAKVKDKVVLKCNKCGYQKAPGNVQALAEKYTLRKRVEHRPEDKIIVVEKEMMIGVKVPAKCPNCGHNEAYYHEQQTRSADEPTTRFFMCTKCGYRWREYD